MASSWSIPGRAGRLSGLLVSVFLAACQTTPGPETVSPSASGSVANVSVSEQISRPPQAGPVSPVKPVPVNDIWGRIRQGSRLTDYYEHPRVEEFVENYAADQALLDLIGSRAQPFLYLIVEELEKRDLPLEIALLPAVESIFDPTAASSASAVGLWQFMPATARFYGLHQDWWYDGRRDPVASTMAALDYLEDLNTRFAGDWLLTLAAYNTGGGNLRRAIRRSGQSLDGPVDFWQLGLARETRFHVPRLLALARVIHEYDALDLALPPISNEVPLIPVAIGSQIDLALAAELAGLEVDELRHYNAGYLQWATHPANPQTLYLPPAPAARLQQKLMTLDPDRLMTWDRYEIKSGDTLGAIARQFNTRVEVLQSANKLSSSRIIAGDSLLIPRGPVRTEVPPPAWQQQRPATAPSRYTVRNGDNLWDIARRFHLSVNSLQRWNSLAGNTIFPGQTLSLRAPVTRP